jgi:uncharacterized protein (DUF1499 family)
MKIKGLYKRNAVISCALIIGALIIMSRFANSTNVAQTSKDHLDKQLLTRHYAASSVEIVRQIQNLAPNLRTYGRKWKIVSTSAREGGIQIVCEVPVLFFVDDLVISIAEDAKSSFVDVRSSSRIGKGDFGENRRHVIQLLSRLDQLHLATAK